MMRLLVLLFVIFCCGMQFHAIMRGDVTVAAVYNVGTLVIASILACTSDRR